jgi:hypothetical protein
MGTQSGGGGGGGASPLVVEVNVFSLLFQRAGFLAKSVAECARQPGVFDRCVERWARLVLMDGGDVFWCRAGW